MVAMIPFVIGSTIYPSIKEILPHGLSAEFLRENKASIVGTSTVVVGTTAYALYTGYMAFASLTPVGYLAIGIGLGYAISEYLTPNIEQNYFPDAIKNEGMVSSIARIAIAPVVAAAVVVPSVKKAAFVYYLSYQFSQTFVTPQIPGINNLSQNTNFAVKSVVPLMVVGAGYGVLQIPGISTAMGTVGIVYTYGSRFMTTVSGTYLAVNTVNDLYIQDKSSVTNIVGTILTFAGGYYASKNNIVSRVTGGINNFVNIDEVILMALLNLMNERLITRTGDAMLDTAYSDISSTVKTGVAWKAGLKKGENPYTGLKTIGAGVKPLIKLAPEALKASGMISDFVAPYIRVVNTYIADLPATYVGSAEKHLSKKTEDALKAHGGIVNIKVKKFQGIQELIDSKDLTSEETKGISLINSFADSDVIISSVTSSCFKTVGTSFGARATKLWVGNIILPSLKRFNQELKEYCSGTISDFCTYVTVHALPKCVKQYLAYKIEVKTNLTLSKEVIDAVHDSIKDVKYFEKNGQDKFCKFLTQEALNNDEDLEIGDLEKIKSKDISDSFWHNLTPTDKSNIQENYLQFASIVEFGSGVKPSVSLLDYMIAFFNPRYSWHLPSLSITELSLVGKVDSIIYTKEIGNTYIFASSVRATTVLMEDYYLPYVKGARYSSLAKTLPVLGGVTYLGREMSGKFEDISAKQKAQEKLNTEEIFIAQGKELLHKDWQKMFSSHKDGMFDSAAVTDSQTIIKSLHLCDEFQGLIKAFGNIDNSNSIVEKIIDEVRVGCKHVEQSFRSLESVPKDSYHLALKKFDTIFKDYGENFDKHKGEVQTLIEIRDTCNIVYRLGKLEQNIQDVCEKVYVYINDLMNAGEKILHEVVGQNLSE